MKNISDVAPSYFAKIQSRQRPSSLTYRSLWLKVSFATIKDGHIRNLGVNAFVIFIILKTYANKKTGRCFPSLKNIHDKSGLSINTVRKAIKVLDEKGWIQKLKQERSKCGVFVKNQYRLLEADLIRGSERGNFITEPLSKNDNGNLNLTHIKNPHTAIKQLRNIHTIKNY